MIRLMLSLVVAALLWGSTVAPTRAEPFCGERAEVLSHLEEKFSERPEAIGLSQDGGLLEIVVSPSGGWTILITYPKRPTCVIATGDGWETLLVTAGQPA